MQNPLPEFMKAIFKDSPVNLSNVTPTGAPPAAPCGYTHYFDTFKAIVKL